MVTHPFAQPSPQTFGHHLLQSARDKGLTSSELADIIGLPVPMIRTLKNPADLDDHRLHVVRVLAEQLGLPWPAWLTAFTPFPDHDEPETPRDAVMVQTVLAHAINTPLHLSDIAEVLDWDIPRVRRAIDRLSLRINNTSGFQLTDTGDTLTLATTPRMFNPAIRTRLARMLHTNGLGPEPTVYHLIYRLTRDDDRTAVMLARALPETLIEATECGYVTHHIDNEGDPYKIELHPDIAYNLGLTDELPDAQPDRH